jgi:hypothetical protein
MGAAREPTGSDDTADCDASNACWLGTAEHRRQLFGCCFFMSLRNPFRNQLHRSLSAQSSHAPIDRFFALFQLRQLHSESLMLQPDSWEVHQVHQLVYERAHGCEQDKQQRQKLRGVFG